MSKGDDAVQSFERMHMCESACVRACVTCVFVACVRALRACVRKQLLPWAEALKEVARGYCMCRALQEPVDAGVSEVQAPISVFEAWRDARLSLDARGG